MKSSALTLLMLSFSTSALFAQNPNLPPLPADTLPPMPQSSVIPPVPAEPQVAPRTRRSVPAPPMPQSGTANAARQPATPPRQPVPRSGLASPSPIPVPPATSPDDRTQSPQYHPQPQPQSSNFYQAAPTVQPYGVQSYGVQPQSSSMMWYGAPVQHSYQPIMSPPVMGDGFNPQGAEGVYVGPSTAGGLHLSFPYYNYRRPWYTRGPASMQVDIVW